MYTLSIFKLRGIFVIQPDELNMFSNRLPRQPPGDHVVLDGDGTVHQRAETATAAVCDGNVECAVRGIRSSPRLHRTPQVLCREVGQAQQSSQVSLFEIITNLTNFSSK